MPGELPEARATRVLINRVAETGFGLYPPHAVGRNRGPDHVEAMRTTLAGVANIDDFLDDLGAAERTLRLYLST